MDLKTKLYLTVMLCLLDMRVLISAQMLDPILHAMVHIFLHEIGKIYACVYKPGGEPKVRLLQQYFLNLQPFPLSWSSEKNMIFYVHKYKINLRTFAQWKNEKERRFNNSSFGLKILEYSVVGHHVIKRLVLMYRLVKMEKGYGWMTARHRIFTDFLSVWKSFKDHLGIFKIKSMTVKRYNRLI